MKLLALLTFPGVIIHEYSHLWACKLFKVKVYDYKLFTLTDENYLGYVKHKTPDRFYKSFFISFAPFVVSSAFAILFLLLYKYVNESEEYLQNFFFWVAFSSIIHSIPSTQDAKCVLEMANEESQYNVFIYLTYPIIWFFYIFNFLGFYGWVLWAGLIFKFMNMG